MTLKAYLSVTDILDCSVDLPDVHSIDSIDFEFDGVAVHVYGVLHGMTGGTNREYVELVNRTIAHSTGLKLGEKGMSSMYSGLNGELEDWVQVPFRDAFMLAFSLAATPFRVFASLKTILRERLTKVDRFGVNNIRRLQDIGGSAAFHLLRPSERRRVAGFPDADDYLIANLLRRRGKGRMEPPRFPDPDWFWLALIEPYTNIPCRSIHMLEFGVALAKRRGMRDLSIFIGEIHNSDIEWYRRTAAADLPEWSRTEVAGIRDLAKHMATTETSFALRLRKLRYSFGLLSGMLMPLYIHASIAYWLWLTLLSGR